MQLMLFLQVVSDLGMPLWSIGAYGYFRFWIFSAGSAVVDNVEKTFEASMVIAIVIESFPAY